MWHFHHAQKRQQQQTISHVKLNISAHTPQVLLNNSPFLSCLHCYMALQ